MITLVCVASPIFLSASKASKEKIIIFSLQIVDKTTKISMNVLMFWSFFKKISLMAKESVVLRDDYTCLSAIVFIF